MSGDAMKKFEKNPEYLDALALRRWDEYGKAPDLDVPSFSHSKILIKSFQI